MKSQTKPKTSQTGRKVTTFRSRRLTPAEIESLRQDMKDGIKRCQELRAQKQAQGGPRRDE